MRRLFISVFLVFLAIAVCVPQASARRKQKIKVIGGANITPIGIAIDASYDPRLDTLVPGYKVVNVFLVNNSFNIVCFDPSGDKWSIKFAGSRKKVNGLYNLRRQDPQAWKKLPEKAKEIIGYPLVLPIGGRQVFDLFIPASVDVSKFNELHAFIKSLNTQFEIMVTQ